MEADRPVWQVRAVRGALCGGMVLTDLGYMQRVSGRRKADVEICQRSWASRQRSTCACYRSAHSADARFDDSRADAGCPKGCGSAGNPTIGCIQASSKGGQSEGGRRAVS
jgi:hypothetical protein